MAQLLIRYVRRQVRNARDPQDFHPHVSRYDRLCDRGHSYDVRSHCSKCPDLRRCLIAWTGESDVYAFMHIQSQASRLCQRNFAILLRIRMRHVGKAWSEPLIIRTDQRIRALQIDVVFQHNERSRLVIGVDSAGRIG